MSASADPPRRHPQPPLGYLPGLLLLALALVLLLATPVRADSSGEREVKAAFLYRFCLYVEWPDAAFETADSPLILGVAGSPAMLDELARVVQDRTVQTRPLEVRLVDSDAALQDLHLVFLSSTASLSAFPSLTDNRPLLVITESPEPLAPASAIHFVLDSNRVRFDVQLDSPRRRGLKLGAQLLQAARHVHGAAP